MKIFHPWQSHEKGKFSFTKIWRITKLFTFFLFAASLQVSAKGYSQNVNIVASDITLNEAVHQISIQTGYSFFVNHKLLKEAGTVSLSLKGATIGEALKACLRDKELSFTIIGKTIILKPKKVMDKSIVNQVLPSHLLTGSVTDSATKSTLSGVTIQVKGTTTGTTTGASQIVVL